MVAAVAAFRTIDAVGLVELPPVLPLPMPKGAANRRNFMPDRCSACLKEEEEELLLLPSWAPPAARSSTPVDGCTGSTARTAATATKGVTKSCITRTPEMAPPGGSARGWRGWAEAQAAPL